MPLFIFKSYLSVVVAILTLSAMYTMFEVFGRPESERKFSIDRLKWLHRINGYLFSAIFIYISFICIKILISQREELSSRVVLHILLALSGFILILLKVAFNRIYRQYYGHIRHIGLVVAVLTLVLVLISGGYYLTVTKFGSDMRIENDEEEMFRETGNVTGKSESQYEVITRTDPISVERGRKLYESECTTCHDPNSVKTIVGPGHKRILKRDRLPISGKEATPANIRNQLIHPYNRMPSFNDLSEEEIDNLIAYLNTL